MMEAGISAPAFVAAQLAGMGIAVLVAHWLWRQPDVVGCPAQERGPRA